jgi:hypothetical protein
MNRLPRFGMIAIVNAAIFLILLVMVEGAFRLWERPKTVPSSIPNPIEHRFHAYMTSMVAPGRYSRWHNVLTGEDYPANIVTNSLGFNDHHEFSYTKPYAKAPNERVVLFVSASAGWGVGATSTDATIPGRMQFHLNGMQDKFKYTVINLSTGPWIAQQQFLALQLWGEMFDPDWVVAMDGGNDAGVGCAYSQGVGNPAYFAGIKSYVEGYLFSTLHPVFYRGWFENVLIRHSAAYRWITGREHIEDTRVFDEDGPDQSAMRQQILPTKVGEAREMLAFYLKAERAILRLYPNARYILSTQPSLNELSGDFVDIYDFPSGSDLHREAMTKRERDLEAYLKHHENEWCGQKTSQPPFTYIFVNGAIGLERLVDDHRARGRQVEYHNIGTLFPNARADRIPYFIDSGHLSDKGADVIGKFYAERVLSADSVVNENGAGTRQ